MRNVIITAAVNGNRPDLKELQIPVTADEIARDAMLCRAAGASVVHFHARDEKTRRSTADVSVFSKVIRAIRSGCDVLIETTTGVGPKIDPATELPIIDPSTGLTIKPSDAERLRLLDIDPPQDLCAIAMGSINMYNPVYDAPVIFINSPSYIAESIARLAVRPNIAFQFEIFDMGFLYNVRRSIDRGLLSNDHGRFWLNYVLGYGGLAADARNLTRVVDEGTRLFPEVPWGVTVAGAEHFKLAAVAASLGASCLRTGFEDVVHLPNGELAGTNARLVEALAKIAQDVGRRLASPSEARAILGLPILSSNG